MYNLRCEDNIFFLPCHLLAMGARGKFQKGETVYINNIPPDDNVDVKVPDSRNSNHINYKVSLVSAGQKTLVAD
jgi:hypothetical protein